MRSGLGIVRVGPMPSGDRSSDFPSGEIELLVEAGFCPVEAIKIAKLNGAIYMGRDKQIGSIAAGKNADLVVIKGDPSTRISDVESLETVFKDGVGYDSQKLQDSVKGRYGEY
jgi:imidazolonepropionase-like amidohydrolase